MDWKQFAIPQDEDYTPLQLKVEALFFAAGGPADVALFVRTLDDRSGEVLLLSPGAVRLFGNAVPPTWESTSIPSGFGWTLLVGHAEAREQLGLRSPDPTRIIPTRHQMTALREAADRQLGTSWTGSRDAAEECCDLGWLEVGHCQGVDVKDPSSIVYDLTSSGRAAMEGRLGGSH